VPPVSTQAGLDTLSAAQLASDTAGALAAEAAVNSKSVANNADGTHTITMSGGTATNYVEVLEMLPRQVTISKGDHVKWVTTAKKDPHTITFPEGSGSNSVDPFGAPVCEGPGTTDTPATAGPPTFGCETAPEAPLNWKPFADAAIYSPTTVATSGIVATFPQAPFPDNYTFSFPVAGTFTYMCRIHDHMVGSIVVTVPAPAAAPPVLAETGGSPWRSLPLLLGALALLCGLALLRVRSLISR
jgi:plastocyanin